MDPWILVSKVLELSKIVPVVAVQPYAIPPYSLAKIIKSLTVLYNRKININLIAGASKSELEQTNELMIHDERYKRLKEYKEVLEYCLTQNTPFPIMDNTIIIRIYMLILKLALISCPSFCFRFIRKWS